MKFTVEEAIKFSKEGKIAEWIQYFLRENNPEKHFNANLPLADGLLLEERFYYGPVIFELDNIKTVRTEKELVDKELDWYNKVVDRMSNDFNGENFPPLILEFKNGEFILTDGNHRYSSLRKLKVDKYYSIIWGSKELESEMFDTLKNNEKRL